MKYRTAIVVILVCSMFCFYVDSASAQANPSARHHPAAVTTGDPSIPLDELELMLKPMKADEIEVEAEAWFKLLRESVYQLNQAKLDLKRQDVDINESVSAQGQNVNRAESDESGQQ